MKKIKKSDILKISVLFIVGLGIGLFFPNFKSDKNTIVDNSGTLLWKITSDKQESPSYLYGTIHLLPEDDFFMGQDVVDAFKNVKSLTLETEMDLPLKEQIALAKQVLLPQGKTLKDYMKEADYDELVSYLKDTLQIKEGHIQRYFMFKPFNLLAFVCMDYYGQIKIYEQEYTNMAKKEKLRINALEDMATQLKVLDESGMAMEMPEGKDIYIIKEYEKLESVYLKKDLDALTDFFKEEMKGETSGNLENKLITERNLNWIPKLDSIISAEPSFIAVGAGHLGGENGIIHLLKEKGYTISPVNN